ncbi:hypothetical protein [[Mycoplasma] phocae]|nr:hypothetical protein [[Mycoplasma] phocae]
MLKELKFKVNDKIIELPFGQVNIIVGPKGSGKSTLLNLIGQAIMNKYIYKDGSKWLKEDANLELISVNIDGSEKLAADFTFYHEKELAKTKNWLEELQNDLPGYISQDDSRKKSLDESNDVKKFKKEKIEAFASDFVSDQDHGLEIFKKLRKLLKEYYLQAEKNINPQVIFKKESTNLEKSKSIIDVEYTNHDVKQTIKGIADNIEKILNDFKTLDNKIRTNKNQIKNEMKNSDVMKSFFDLLAIEEIFELENQFLAQKDALVDKYKSLQKINIKGLQTFDIFKNAYDSQKKQYKAKMSSDLKLEEEWKILLKYFKDMGAKLAELKQQYDSIINEEIIFNWTKTEDISNDRNSLRCELHQIVMDDDEKITFLNNYIGSENKRQTIRDLIRTEDKLDKTSSNEYLEKKVIIPLIENHVEIYAGKKRYQDMSLGEKSLFGINYVLDNIQNYRNNADYLLLDQIEDNLDNKTITENILPLLLTKKQEGQQMFIVTHNSNIGTLLEGQVIIANIFDEIAENKFRLENIIINNDTEETGESLYLEGGIKSLKKRSEIIAKKISDNHMEEK